VTINGSNSGTSLKADVSGDISTDLSTVVSGLAFDTADGSRASNESWIDGRITVASDNVTLDGLRLHSYNGALKFDGTDIDSFTLKNSYVTGFNGADSLAYTGDGTNEGWTITGNMIGGVAGGVGGSLYLTNINAAQVAENVFFRPAAAHMYLTDASNVTVSDNFFYHGVHADGANFDNKLTAFQAAADAGYGYVGFKGGSGYGYGGYGFGYGYGSSNSDSFTEMGSYGGYGGYGPTGYIPTGYGLDAYGGGGSSQADYVFYGRNYIAEVKGDSDTINFSGNWGAYNSGGIQFWDELDSDHSFNSVTISQNQMSNFINADQDGLLETLSSRHKSGLVGGVVFQVKDGSTSDNLTISGNKIYGSIDQILNDNDLDALIEVDGEVNNVVISDNTLQWSGSVASSTQIDGNSGKVVTQGILLAGDVNGGATTGQYIILKDNTFETAAIGKSTYVSDAILLSDTDYSSLGIGQLSSDVVVIDGSSSTYAAWVNSDDVGNYDEGHATDGSADTTTYDLNALDTSIGGYTQVTAFVDSQQDILYLQTNTIA